MAGYRWRLRRASDASRRPAPGKTGKGRDARTRNATSVARNQPSYPAEPRGQLEYYFSCAQPPVHAAVPSLASPGAPGRASAKAQSTLLRRDIGRRRQSLPTDIRLALQAPAGPRDDQNSPIQPDPAPRRVGYPRIRVDQQNRRGTQTLTPLERTTLPPRLSTTGARVVGGGSGRRGLAPGHQAGSAPVSRRQRSPRTPTALGEDIIMAHAPP